MQKIFCIFLGLKNHVYLHDYVNAYRRALVIKHHTQSIDSLMNSILIDYFALSKVTVRGSDCD